MLSQASMQNSEYKKKRKGWLPKQVFPSERDFENAAQNKRNLEA